MAGAPISWGVSETPDWGRMLSCDRVLADMCRLGLRATELGPDGFLPREPGDLGATLARFGLRLVAGFVPAVLHRADPPEQPVAEVAGEADRLAQAGADVLVVAAASGVEGYEDRPTFDDAGWARVVRTLQRLAEVVGSTGLTLTVHPHVGTLIEGPAEIEQLLETTDVSLCVDTGHLAIGGTDPLSVARDAPQRVGHVHLKDVDLGLAEAVRLRRMGYLAAVRQGLYRPLGRGDVDVAGVMAALEGAGYRGWYVLEQDVSLPADDPDGAADPAADVGRSLEFVREVERQLGTATDPPANANATTARARRNWGIQP